MEKNFKILNVSLSSFKKILLLNQNKKLVGKNKIIFKKNDFIISRLLNELMYIYKGNRFRNLLILKFHFSFRYGSFCFTRKPFKFIQKAKSQIKNIKR